MAATKVISNFANNPLFTPIFIIQIYLIDMLRVSSGTNRVKPSRSLVIIIWQPSLEVGVSPKARSSMSSSSSLGSESFS